MRRTVCQAWAAMAVLVALPAVGCNMVPRSQLARCQEANRTYMERYKAAMAEKANGDRHAQELADQNIQAEQELGSLRDRNGGLEEQLANLRTGQQQMDQQLAQMQQWRPQANPLPSQTTDRLSSLAQRYPGSFEFDPATGISKFNTDILFETGKDALRPEAERMLAEFAGVFNSAEVHDYNIMVVGHTDDQRIARAETRAQHPSNWHLSAHRAIAVQQYLRQAGIADARMGVGGFGEHQPLVANNSAESRQRNRRVEIYVLSPDTAVAGRTDGRRRYPADQAAVSAPEEPY